jgi:predicted SnoaL-like aldol condensation-catalyzing enzyme
VERDHTRQLIANFIEDIWNQQQLNKIERYLHPDYMDHSLPAPLTPDRAGLSKWIQATNQSFSHRTLIEDQVTEGNKSIIKIKMMMTHIGTWRGIEPTGAQVSTVGYRFYRLMDNKIVEHWAEINGNMLESQLMHQGGVGCGIPQ